MTTHRPPPLRAARGLDRGGPERAAEGPQDAFRLGPRRRSTSGAGEEAPARGEGKRRRSVARRHPLEAGRLRKYDADRMYSIRPTLTPGTPHNAPRPCGC